MLDRLSWPSKWLLFILIGSAVFYGSYRLAFWVTPRGNPTVAPYIQGSILPDGVVYGDDGAGVPWRDVAEGRPITFLSVFTPGCTSCVGEATRWRDLAVAYGDSAAFIAVAATPDLDFTGDLSKAARLPFPVLRAEDRLRRQLSAAESPTIYILDWEYRVEFAEAGPSATDLAEVWFGERFGG
ncbi:MAG: hypothetical protein RLN75_04220 [Longimicrobiales bacterium]